MILRTGQRAFGNIRWFTNLKVSNMKFLKLSCEYSPEKYPKYDNYDVINVDKVEEIPHSFSGIIGVPISFLDKYVPDQYEIVGVSGQDKFRTKVYLKQIQINPNGERKLVTKLNDSATLKIDSPIPGKTCYQVGSYYYQAVYKRLFIRKIL